jgi:transposase
VPEKNEPSLLLAGAGGLVIHLVIKQIRKAKFMTDIQHEGTMATIEPKRRRRWPVDIKMAIVQESFESGKSASMVARQYGVNPNQLFYWRKLYRDGRFHSTLTSVSHTAKD